MKKTDEGYSQSGLMKSQGFLFGGSLKSFTKKIVRLRRGKCKKEKFVK